jgi:hypothetical protein
MDSKIKFYVPSPMMRIVLLVFFYTLLLVGKIYAQGLSVELSIEWKRTKIDFSIPPLKQDTTILMPSLKIIYRNYTGKDVYFKKLAADYGKYPPVISGTLINTNMDLTERVKNHSSYLTKSFNVKMETDQSWEISEVAIDEVLEREFNPINEDISNIHQVLITQMILDRYRVKKQLACFDDSTKHTITFTDAKRLISNGKWKLPQDIDFSDLNGELIVKKKPQMFIFLKNQQIRIQEFDLIGFFLAGGNFSFSLTETFISDYIVGRNNSERIYLPRKVNGYELYEGTLCTNSVVIRIVN